MHGDDVASAGVEVSTQIVSKTTELIMEMIKIAIEKERGEKGFKANSEKVLSGGEVTYQKLKNGGEVTMLPSFAKEDYKAFLKKAKAMDIPVAAMQEHGKENTLSLFFNVKDKEAVNSIVQDIVREKLNQPEQSERMITIEKGQVEGFQMYCSEHDIPVNFLETNGGVKCIFNSSYEKQMEMAVENYRNIQSELSQIGMEVEKNAKGKFQFKLMDNEQGKQLTMNFCTKAKLERVLRERMGYSEVKAVEVANSLADKLTDSQRQYYLSDSRQIGEMDFYEKDIKFPDNNLLLENYSFTKLKLDGEDEPKLTVTDKSGNFVVLSAKNLDREDVEDRLRAYLKINDSETIKAILDKSERLGFAEQPKQVQFKEFQIERETQNSFTVRGGSTVVRLNLNDKMTAKKQLTEAFGISAGKAEKIIGKAQKQKVADNLLKKAREKVKDAADTIRHKKIERGSRK
ncbi:MAG: DUF3801 domain-containing protein [Lachnospiraceae bacterium]|nr:DUF3801 domain-containing protein [Ruminococcus sp.]MCM1277132.1 DUF3801 domain-containing protein [Lachnospiraceae bacterium]